MFSLTENVQAVDELGRWESGRIVEISETEQGQACFKIHFPGWSPDFDVVVSSAHVRKPIDCFFVSGRKRTARNSETSQKLDALKTMTRDDTVRFLSGEGQQEGEVWIVDKFKRTVTVKVEGMPELQEIPVEALTITEKDPVTCDPPVKKRCKTKNKPMVSNDNGRALAQCNDGNLLDSGPPLELRSQSSDVIVSGLYQADGRITCGKSYLLLPQKIYIAVTEIYWRGSFFAKGFAFNDDDRIDRTVEVSAPVDRLQEDVRKLTLQVRKELIKIGQEQYRKFRQILDSKEVRAVERRSSVRGVFRKELKAAFASKILRRTFSIGMYNHEFDEELFGVEPLTSRRISYSYRNGNLHFLDNLLWEKWDIVGQKFVTQVTFLINKESLIGTIFIACCPNNVSQLSGYREHLELYIAEESAA